MKSAQSTSDRLLKKKKQLNKGEQLMRAYEDKLSRIEDNIKKMQNDDQLSDQAFQHFKAEREIDCDTQQNRIEELTKLNEVLLKRVDELNYAAQSKNEEKDSLLVETETLKFEIEKVEEAIAKLDKRYEEMSFTTKRGNSYNQFKMQGFSKGSTSFNKISQNQSSMEFSTALLNHSDNNTNKKVSSLLRKNRKQNNRVCNECTCVIF